MPHLSCPLPSAAARSASPPGGLLAKDHASQGRAGWGEGGLGRACLALTGMGDLADPYGRQLLLSSLLTGLTGTDLSLIIPDRKEETLTAWLQMSRGEDL
jgi:hypothetical protein